MANQWKTVGSVRKNEKGNFYLKVTEGITLSKDDVLQLQDPRKKLKESVAAGRLTEERAEELANKIPEYVKYDVVLPPKK